MMHRLARQYRSIVVRAGIVFFLVASSADRDLNAVEPAIEGYSNYAEMRKQLESIAGDEAATLRSLGTTLGGREVYLLTLSIGDAEKKPAILLMGSVHAPHLAGSELAVRIARQLVSGKDDDNAIKKLLSDQTIYVIPRPSPDASEAFFHKPHWERTGNARATDDDRDGRTNEDPPDDLNGDGVITMMRIEDPAGAYMAHPDEPRIMIKADRAKNEPGTHRLVIEGFDNDSDDEQAEDGPGGTAFDKNFTFEYPYFAAGAGPHQVSEPETRAVADFAFNHRNIYLVFSFSPHENFVTPWKAGGSGGRIPKSVHGDDAKLLDHLSKRYRDALDAKDAPASPEHGGSFVHWAYFHLGRWSVATRGWWIPKVEAPKKEKDDADDDDKKEVDPRGSDQRNALRWFEQQGIDGFVRWTRVAHPDYPDKRVEVGGFRPYLQLNPPADQLDELAEKHTKYLIELAGVRSKLTLHDVKAEALGGGLFRVKATLRNDGFLPSASAMGERTGKLQRLQMEMELPDGVRLVHGAPRVGVRRLTGNGAEHEQHWLVRTSGDEPSQTARVVAGSPTTGVVAAQVVLESQDEQQEN